MTERQEIQEIQLRTDITFPLQQLYINMQYIPMYDLSFHIPPIPNWSLWRNFDSTYPVEKQAFTDLKKIYQIWSGCSPYTKANLMDTHPTCVPFCQGLEKLQVMLENKKPIGISKVVELVGPIVKTPDPLNSVLVTVILGSLSSLEKTTCHIGNLFQLLSLNITPQFCSLNYNIYKYRCSLGDPNACESLITNLGFHHNRSRLELISKKNLPISQATCTLLTEPHEYHMLADLLYRRGESDKCRAVLQDAQKFQDTKSAILLTRIIMKSDPFKAVSIIKDHSQHDSEAMKLLKHALTACVPRLEFKIAQFPVEFVEKIVKTFSLADPSIRYAIQQHPLQLKAAIPYFIDVIRRMEKDGLDLFDILKQGKVPCVGCGQSFLTGAACEKCPLKACSTQCLQFYMQHHQVWCHPSHPVYFVTTNRVKKDNSSI